MPVTRVSWTTQVKNEPWVNVLSFGAKGDGTTDDSAAINAAINSIGAFGGTVYFPGTAQLTPAVYLLNLLGIDIPCDNITLRGDGGVHSIIKMANSSAAVITISCNAHTDISIIDLGFEGNFINHAYTPATLNTCINASDTVRLKVFGCRFHGYGDQTALSYAQVISLYTVKDAEIRNNEFYSNIAFEINMNGAVGVAITDNTFGVDNMSESRANVNWWDTYAGGFGTLCIGSSQVYFSGNRMFGGTRVLSGDTPIAYPYLISSGGGLVQMYDVKIQNNEFYGLANSRGTVSVTNGSGTVTGLNTYFWSGDVGRALMVEGDGTIYKITGYTSATQITVTPVIVRSSAANLRYLYQNSGDVISVGPVSGLTITGNTVDRSGDNGIDLGAGLNQFTDNVLVSNNRISNGQIDGMNIGGATFNIIVSNNIFINNCRKQLAGHRAAILMSPTNQGIIAAQPMWHMTFIGNNFIDSDGISASQLYAFDIENGQQAHLFSNTHVGNTYFAYSGGGGLFDPSVTPTIQGQIFNQTSIQGVTRLLPVAFAKINDIDGSQPQDGMMLYCFDAKGISDGVAAGSTAVGGGNGAMLFRQNGLWKVGF
jgi:hypothetical protein